MKRLTAMQLLVKFNHKFEVRATEWLCATILFFWGVVLLSSPNVFVDSTHYHRTLQTIASQQVWGWSTFSMGAIRLVALYVNGARRETPFARTITAILSSFFWYQIALGFAISGVINTALAVYPVLLIFEIYNVLRSSIDARQAYDEARVVENGTE